MRYVKVLSASMKKFFIFFFLVFLSSQSFSLALLDSVGTTTVKGEEYIVHEVEAGETLYALSRKYNVEVQAINEANAGSVSSLNIGQKLLIPLIIKKVPQGASVHIVKSSETLFSISRLYKVNVDDLKKWNNLAESSISIGQELIIKEGNATTQKEETEVNQTGSRKTHTVAQSQTLYSISRMYGVSTDDLVEWNSLGSNALNIGQILIVSSPGTNNTDAATNSSMLPPEEKDAYEVQVEDDIDEKSIVTTSPAVTVPFVPDENDTDEIAKPAAKIVEKGMCEVIENAPDTKKYLAFHRDAPVGTIMQVRNEMNNQSVFVRVVNTIPQIGDNSKVMLQISKKAFDRLGAVDKRFPVEISYIP